MCYNTTWSPLCDKLRFESWSHCMIKKITILKNLAITNNRNQINQSINKNLNKKNH